MGRSRRRQRKPQNKAVSARARPRREAWPRWSITAITLTAAVLGGVVSVQQIMQFTNSSDSDNAARPDQLLELKGDGLGDVKFGDDLDLAIAEIREVFGSANDDGQTECESGADTLVFWDDLYIVGDDGAFVGWSYSPELEELPDTPLQSESGVTIGTTLAHLYALFRNDVFVSGRTTLSDEIGGKPTVEFVIQDALGQPEDWMSGFLTGRDRGDVVTQLSGGDDCAFR